MVKFNPSLGREAKNRSKTSHAVWQGTAPVRPTPQGETAGEVFSFGETKLKETNATTRFGADEHNARSELDVPYDVFIPDVDYVLSNTIEYKKKLSEYYVYVLVNNGSVVYVGQTSNIETRLLAHEKTKEFDSYFSIECDRKYLSAFEAELIVKLNPILNSTLPSQVKYITKSGASKIIGGRKLRKLTGRGLIKSFPLYMGSVYLLSEIIEWSWRDV